MIIFFTAAVSLTACGATKVSVKPEALLQIKSIAVTEVAEPETYTGNDFGNIGAAFGAIGGVFVGTSSANATKSIDQIAADKGFSAGKSFTALLQEKLTSSGYQVKLISPPRVKKYDLIEKYETVSCEGADAILDVAIQSIGYATEHPLLSPYWRPAAQVKVNLVNCLTAEKIYSEKFMYGYHNPFMSGTDLDAPEKYHFSNKEELFKDATLMVEGMRDSVDEVANQISQSLHR